MTSQQPRETWHLDCGFNTTPTTEERTHREVADDRSGGREGQGESEELTRNQGCARLVETGEKDTKTNLKGFPSPTLGSFEHQKEKRQ